MRTKTLNDRTRASDPGGIRLSHVMMREIQPELYQPKGLFRLLNRLSPLQNFWMTRNEEHLLHGDSRAAVVLHLHPLLIAAYTDELDCIALLKFESWLAEKFQLQVGTQLLTVNLYHYGQTPVTDLESGPATYGRYSNFVPFIADFLSKDVARIEYRKTEIRELEWERTRQLGTAYLQKHGQRARDGRPLKCHLPAF